MAIHKLTPLKVKNAGPGKYEDGVGFVSWYIEVGSEEVGVALYLGRQAAGNGAG